MSDPFNPMTEARPDIAGLVAELRGSVTVAESLGSPILGRILNAAASALEALSPVPGEGVTDHHIATVFRWMVSKNAPNDILNHFSALTAANLPHKGDEWRDKAKESVVWAACRLIASDINVYPNMSRADAVNEAYWLLNDAVERFNSLQPAAAATPKLEEAAGEGSLIK